MREKQKESVRSYTSTLSAVVLVVLLNAGGARAQVSPFFENNPELSMYDVLAPFSGDEGDLQLGLMFSVAPHADLEADRATTGTIDATTRLLLGMTDSPTTFLRLSTFLLAPYRLDSEESQEQIELEDLSGSHRMWGRVGLLDFPCELGVDLSLDVTYEHSGDRPLFIREDVARRPFNELNTEAGIWFRRGDMDEFAWVMPFTYQLRRVDYPVPGLEQSGFLSHRFSSGIGLRDFTWAHQEGWIELVGVSWTRTDFNRDSGSDPIANWNPRRGTIDQLDLRLLNVDRLIVPIDSVVFISGQFFLGGSWLFDEGGGDSATLFTVGFGEAFRYSDGELAGEFGFSISRRGGHSPDGNRFVANNRIELNAEYTDKEVGVGFAHREIFDFVSHPEVETLESSQPDAVPSMSLHTEWFIELVEVELGAYHQANYGTSWGAQSWTPLNGERTWEHEVGFFLRLNESIGESDRYSMGQEPYYDDY